jgi:hypothetical protein
MALSATCISVGIMWDISWHETVGRDSFWTPAHMTIYLGGILGGVVGGWLAVKCTFMRGLNPPPSVKVLGARAPLGAWVAIWGALAMLTSAPFDNWWHNAYGLDVQIISPPHSVLGFGMFAIVFGALLLVLTRQNRLQDGTGSGLFIYVGGIFLAMAGVFVMEYVFPNMQHAALFYKVCALAFPIRLVTMGKAGRASWPATRLALVYTLFVCLVAWILPLFPGHPKLAPIFNPVTHMVPPPFPLLLVLPAIGVDLILRRTVQVRGWKLIPLAVLLGTVFLVVLVPAQWFFAEFLLSPAGDNWFFLGNQVWDYSSRVGPWTREFWHAESFSAAFNWRNLLVCLGLATLTSWLGLLLGGWMRKVQR